MKISHILLLTMISVCLTIISCKDNKTETATEGQTTTSPEGVVSTNPSTPGTQQIAIGGEPHYKCTKEGCPGKGVAAGKCAICGSDLAHNQAFHAQNGGAPGSSPANPVQVDPNGGNPATPTPTPPPAQNAKGEYHYTCPNGHPGAATAGNCAKCGQPLTHNQAYHSN